MWQKKIKKTLFTLAIGNYEPEICSITFPLLKRYANKIGADFYPITERKFLDWNIRYEKLQIYQLAQDMENDWNIYIDADALIHPEMVDVTELIPKDTVAHMGNDYRPVRYKSDRFFLRDGRNISCCNWFTVASDRCIELWEPQTDITQEDASASCFPTVDEANTVFTPDKLVDDYVLSRNVAKYGLKFTTFTKRFKDIGMGDSWFAWHAYTIPPEQKLLEMKNIVKMWRLT
jgi:hypothetical protein